MPAPNLCPLCGKTNPPNEWACEHCGARLPSANPRPPKGNRSKINQAIEAEARTNRLKANREETPTTYIFVGLLLLFLAVLLSIGKIHWMRAPFINPARYSKAPGRVLESYVTYHGSRHSGRSYHIRYSYKVGDRTYESTTLAFAPKSGKAHTYKDRYPVGANVTVYYLPEEPTFAVLEPQVAIYPYQLLTMVAASTFAALALFGTAWFKKRQQTPAVTP